MRNHSEMTYCHGVPLAQQPVWHRLAALLAEQGYRLAGYVHGGHTAVLESDPGGYAFVNDNGGELQICIMGYGATRPAIPWPDDLPDMTTLYRFLQTAKGASIDWGKRIAG